MKTFKKFRTHDVSIQYRMSAGIPGNITRPHQASTQPEVLDVTNYPTAYGVAVVVDASTGGLRKVMAGDTRIDGFYVRPYPIQGNGTDGLGVSTPPVSGLVDRLTRGYMTVLLGGAAAATKEGVVYIRTANPSALKLAATAAITTASPNIAMTTNSLGIVGGMTVFNETIGKVIGTVSTFSSTSLVLTANALYASQGSADVLSFSYFGDTQGKVVGDIEAAKDQTIVASATTGTGTSTAGTLSASQTPELTTPAGVYTVTCSATSQTSAIVVTDATGVIVGNGVVGTQCTCNNGLSFLITAGGTVTAGDHLSLTVTNNTFALSRKTFFVGPSDANANVEIAHNI